MLQSMMTKDRDLPYKMADSYQRYIIVLRTVDGAYITRNLPFLPYTYSCLYQGIKNRRQLITPNTARSY
jgi:hypothetical protein